METSGFFDAMELEDGSYDKTYIAEQFANFFSLFIGNGVFGSPDNQLKIVAKEDMIVTMKKGFAFINGYWYYNDTDKDFEISPNYTATDRVDSIVVRLDKSERTITSLYQIDEDEIIRNDNYYELQVALINVSTGVNEILDSMIVDKRVDESVCGLVTGILETIGTNDLFLHFESQFMQWFDEMKDQLSEDAAGSLQLQLNEIKEREKTYLTSVEFQEGDEPMIASDEVPNKLILKTSEGEWEVDASHRHTIGEIIAEYMQMRKTFYPPTGASKPSLRSILLDIASHLTSDDTRIIDLLAFKLLADNRLSELEDGASDTGEVIFAYKEITTEAVSMQDTKGDWNKYKAFVVGLQCNSAGTIEWSTTRYIPKHLAGLGGIRHAISLRTVGTSSDTEYTCDATVTFAANQTVRFMLTGISNFTNPRMFLYGIR